MRFNQIFRSLLLMFLIIPLCAHSQNKANSIINDAIKHYQKQMKNVNDMTMVYEDGISYFKQSSDVTKTRSEFTTADGFKTISIYDGSYYWTKYERNGEVSKQEMETAPQEMVYHLDDIDFTYKSKERVDNAQCHVVFAEDVSIDELPMATAKQQLESAGQEDLTFDVTLYIDVNKKLTRKMIFEFEDLELAQNDKKRSASMTMINKDFRNISGLDVAFKTETITEIEMSPEERAQMKEAQKQMEEMEKQMKDMPPEQREMIKSRMNKMQGMGMLNGEIKTTKIIEEVKINTGLDDSLFDPESL
ncbi:MAG: DUF3106 domain-containing protein [Bacteroidales bacterium]|nr:DUF3106 domain-containing protein [Bacteroidales bacterium]